MTQKNLPPWPEFFFVLNGFKNGDTEQDAVTSFTAPDKLADGWWYVYPEDDDADIQGPFLSKNEAVEHARPVWFLGHWWRPVGHMEATYHEMPDGGTRRATTAKGELYWHKETGTLRSTEEDDENVGWFLDPLMKD